MAVSIAEKLSVSVQWLLEGVGPIDRNTATVYQSQAPYKKTVQAIVDILDELSEAERKDTLTLLQATFPPEPEESEEKKARSEESKNNEGKNDKKKSKDNKSDIADNEKGTAKTVASTPQTNKPPSQRIHSSCSPHPSWECE